MKAVAATDQKLGTLLRMREAAFMEWGAVPQEILYDRMKTVWTGTDDRGEIIWNSVFLDFARYWGFTPRLCRPYRAQTKGKIESGVKYVRRNFLCGLQGREPASLSELNSELRRWIAEVANKRVHGTTHQQVLVRWDEDQFAMQPVNGRLPYPYIDEELRKVARDAYVSWMGSRYSVPWIYAGEEVWVQDRGASIEVHYGGKRIAAHVPAVRKHQLVTQYEHHHGIPLGNKQSGKTLIHIEQTAPSYSTDHWPPMKSCSPELRCDSHRAPANDPRRDEPHCNQCAAGSPSRSCFKERTVLCRLPARSDER